ncbi:MAG: hypothetical protein QM604_07655, partial [Microbacterium sp.]
ARLRRSFRFYSWGAARAGSGQHDGADPSGGGEDAPGVVRWVCSFDTTEADVDAFVAAIARETTA